MTARSLLHKAVLMTSLLIVLSIGPFCDSASALAQSSGPPQLPAEDTPYEFLSTKQDLSAALQFFGKNLGIGVDIDPKISGKTGAKTSLTTTRRDYIEGLAAEFGLVWFFDGMTLHIATAGSVETELFPLEHNDALRVLESLARLKMYQPKFVHRFDLKNHVLLVSGPPAYVRIVRKSVEAIEKSTRTETTVLRGAQPLPVPMTPEQSATQGGDPEQK